MSLRRQAHEILANQRSLGCLNAFVSHANNRKELESTGKHRASPEDATESAVKGRLISVKDNICTKDEPTTCASSILHNYQSPYAATVVSKLEAAGALINGKTNLDEFGMGSHSIHSDHGPVKSHLGNDLSAGGSSGGSAIAVATQHSWAALGTDTGGSVRLPAAYTGTVGFKPSYGMVSRHGVVAYANSLDTVGILACSSKIVQDVFDVIRGYDPNDPTSISTVTCSRIEEQRRQDQSSQNVGRRHYRIGIPREYNIKELDPVVRQAWLKTLILLQEEKHDIRAVSLPTTQAALSAYYIIAPAEASSNLAKYDGIRFGTKFSERQTTDDVLFAITRGNGLGEEVRKRILLGSYSLSAAAMDNYFVKAQKVRRLVQQDFNHVFARYHPLLENEQRCDDRTGVDVIISPTVPSLPPRISSITSKTSVNAYSDDVFTVPASLAGLPAISLPVPIEPNDLDGDLKTTGLQIIGQYGDDDLILDFSRKVQNLYSATTS
ncbi:Trimeric GatFAB AmidoTransferase(AdT) complex subunit [Pseudocyphellaria aurata]|nr:Trimeric GatFAB AmidoTransferase(AdT) complex subunit [Pseudocyphellaria aurata]